MTDELAELRAESERIARQVEEAVPDFRFDRSDFGPEFGGACPWQGWGTYRGLRCYLRYRGDRASMTVWRGDADDDYSDGDVALCSVLDNYFNDPWCGSLHDAEILPFVRALVERLAPPSEENLTSYRLLAQAVDELMRRLGGEPLGPAG